MSSRPKPATTSSPFMSADHSTCSMSPTAVDVECKAGPTHSGLTQCSSIIRAQEGWMHQDQHRTGRHGRHRSGSRRREKDSTFQPSPYIAKEVPQGQQIPESLACLLVQMYGDEGRPLADAFLWATEFPPITKQSLSELDIQNIIQNARLRHDINFDKDLSFRPNIDGAKGEEKMKAATQYWDALVAEMELYARLFQGTPALLDMEDAMWPKVIEHAERRIPTMFDTIHDILKSLVPDMDHSRVEEHLDRAMLMQEIERGMCDLVRLAEWLACLLKEHCAPMRDEMVDKMVDETRSGAGGRNSKQIVNGLRTLLGILEAMKLDVANHQIRNLKTLLINDTINFERQYHLDRLVSGRSRVNLDIARSWYNHSYGRFQRFCVPQLRNMGAFYLEIFARAVVSSLFCGDAKMIFPETFYLDYDRLLALKAEISDIMHFQICFDVFEEILRDYRHASTVPQTTGHILLASISALIGEGAGHRASQWMAESDHIAAELVRQAHILLRYPPVYDFDVIQRWNHRLRAMFTNRFVNHSLVLESQLRPRVLLTVKSHSNSSTVELFNKLTTTPGPPPVPFAPSQLFDGTEQRSEISTPPYLEQLTDLSNRISHIIILHWRIWGDIAYVQEGNTQYSALTASTSRPATPAHSDSDNAPPSPPICTHPQPPATASIESATEAADMKTDEPPDPDQEALELAGFGSSMP